VKWWKAVGTVNLRWIRIMVKPEHATTLANFKTLSSLAEVFNKGVKSHEQRHARDLILAMGGDIMTGAVATASSRGAAIDAAEGKADARKSEIVKWRKKLFKDLTDKWHDEDTKRLNNLLNKKIGPLIKCD